METTALFGIALTGAIAICVILFGIWKYGHSRYQEGYEEGRKDAQKEWHKEKLRLYLELKKRIVGEDSQVIPSKKQGKIKKEQ